MCDICIVVNSLPGGGEELRFGAVGPGQCVHLNSGTKFLWPKPDLPREKRAGRGLRLTLGLLLVRSH